MKLKVPPTYAKLPSPQKETMLQMRKTILEIVPNAEEVISYGMPAFKLNGSVIAGLMSNKHHVGYYPFSGSVVELFGKELAKFKTTKSAIHVPIDKPLSKTLISMLLKARISQCPVKQGKVDFTKYESKGKVWKELGIAAPARRGLIDHGILTLEDLRAVDLKTLRNIHGVGEIAFKILTKARRASTR